MRTLGSTRACERGWSRPTAPEGVKQSCPGRHVEKIRFGSTRGRSRPTAPEGVKPSSPGRRSLARRKGKGKPSMRLHVLQHVDFEGPGHLSAWAERRGARLSSTRFFAGDPLPSLDAFDGLVVMGGPMGVFDHAEYPWLRREREFVRSAIDAGRTVVGICLGSQLIADALGPRSIPAPRRKSAGFPSGGPKTPRSPSRKPFRPFIGTAIPSICRRERRAWLRARSASIRASLGASASWPSNFTWKPPPKAWRR